MNDIKQFTDINGVTHDIKDYRISSIVDAFYPIGSIYLTVNSANPAVLFGGTWELIKGRFLLGTGVPDDNTNPFWGTDLTYDGENKHYEDVNSTGGETRHTLAISEMPSHDHGILSGFGDKNDPAIDSDGFRYEWWGGNNRGYNNAFISSTGGNAAHNNMPPYYTVNMWKRIA